MVELHFLNSWKRPPARKSRITKRLGNKKAKGKYLLHLPWCSRGTITHPASSWIPPKGCHHLGRGPEPAKQPPPGARLALAVLQSRSECSSHPQSSSLLSAACYGPRCEFVLAEGKLKSCQLQRLRRAGQEQRVKTRAVTGAVLLWRSLWQGSI